MVGRHALTELLDFIRFAALGRQLAELDLGKVVVGGLVTKRWSAVALRSFTGLSDCRRARSSAARRKRPDT